MFSGFEGIEKKGETTDRTINHGGYGSVVADGQFPTILDFWILDFARYQCLKLRNSCQ